MLVGCSYFDRPEPDIDDLAWAEGKDQTQAVIESKPLPEPVDVVQAIARKTQGRVQLFSLESPLPSESNIITNTSQEIAPVNAMEKPGSWMPENGIANHSTRSVQIFPVQ